MSKSEQANVIDRLAAASLESQFEQIERLSVDVETSVSALASGRVESITVDGHGLESEGLLRTNRLHLETEAIAINPWKAVIGKIELQDSVDAIAQMSFALEDINAAANSKEFLDAVEKVAQESLQASTRLVEIRLEPEDEAIKLVIIASGDYQLQALVKPQIVENSLSFVLQSEEEPKELLCTLIKQLEELFHVNHFASAETTLAFTDVELTQDSLKIRTEIEMFDLPM